MHYALAFTFGTLACACASAAPEPTPAPAPSPAPRSGMSIVAPPDVALPPLGARSTASGLSFLVMDDSTVDRYRDMMEPGPPQAGDTVAFYCVGWTASGRPFDDQLPPSEPREVRLDKLPLGLVEGLQLMRVGNAYRFWLPPSLTNPKGGGGAPPGMLVYDVKLVGIAKAKPLATTVPDFPGLPPADAMTTASGLVYQVIEAGKGPSPTRANKVVVHYTGWTTDGKMFDSSVARGAPATFPVAGVIAGFAEGITLMQPNAHLVLWIPEALAYQGKPGAPQGMLVFDVTLIDIE